MHDAAELVATAAHKLITRAPAGIDADDLDSLATRGRGLLARGTGRLAIYTLGQRLDHDAPGRRARRARRLRSATPPAPPDGRWLSTSSPPASVA